MTRAVLVTGAGGALGSALCQYFVSRGWQVTGVVRETNADLLEGLPELTVVEADLSSEAGLDRVSQACQQPLDLLVHAAVMNSRQPDELDGTSLDAIFRVNASAPYRISQRLLARTDTDQRLTIVCINSEAIFHADASSGVYAASKAALRVFTSALANSARGTASAVASLVLGPLSTPDRQAEFTTLAERHGQDPKALARVLLARSNPDLVIDEFIPLEACCNAVEHLYHMGKIANGTTYRLDGGSSGSLI